ncbi:MAG: hypothetical protein ACI4T8_03005 [Christensenellales bacterium]
MDSDGYPSPRKGKIRLARVQWLVNVKESLVVPYVVISSNGKYKYYDIKGRREFTVKASKSASDERLIELLQRASGITYSSKSGRELLTRYYNPIFRGTNKEGKKFKSKADFINSIIDDSYAYEDVRKIALAIQRSMKATRGMYLDYIKTMAQKSNNLLEWE